MTEEIGELTKLHNIGIENGVLRKIEKNNKN